MTDYLTTDTELTSVANAIRTKGGTSAALTYPTGFVSAIEAIPTGGGTLPTCTMTISGSGDDVACSNFSGSAPSGTYVAIAELYGGDYSSCLGVFIGTRGITSLSEAAQNEYNATFAMNEPATPGIVGYIFSQNYFAFANNDEYYGDYGYSFLSSFAGTYTATVIEF